MYFAFFTIDFTASGVIFFHIRRGQSKDISYNSEGWGVHRRPKYDIDICVQSLTVSLHYIMPIGGSTFFVCLITFSNCRTKFLWKDLAVYNHWIKTRKGVNILTVSREMSLWGYKVKLLITRRNFMTVS